MAPETDAELAELHRYVFEPGGKPGINVTTISNLLDHNGKSSKMAGAAVRLTNEGKKYREVWDEKRDAGTRVHKIFESWLLTGQAEVEEKDQGFVDGLEKFWVEHEPEKIEVEAVALSHHGFGGRFDTIVRLSSGRTLLVDLKSGREYDAEHTLQLSAYRYSDGIGVYENGMLTGTRLLPAVDGCACLYVRSDGTYKLVEYPADEYAFAQFLNLLSVYHWLQTL